MEQWETWLPRSAQTHTVQARTPQVSVSISNRSMGLDPTTSEARRVHPISGTDQADEVFLHFNIAAENFYIMKLCSRLFVLYCRNCPKDDKFRHFIPILRKLGAA